MVAIKLFEILAVSFINIKDCRCFHREIIKLYKSREYLMILIKSHCHIAGLRVWRSDQVGYCGSLGTTRNTFLESLKTSRQLNPPAAAHKAHLRSSTTSYHCCFNKVAHFRAYDRNVTNIDLRKDSSFRTGII